MRKTNVIQMTPPGVGALRCTSCGAQTDAPCSCGKPFAYIPAREAAAKAVAAHPEKSDRAIAEKLGVHKNTVARARADGGPKGPPEKRIGRDGKKQAATKTRRKSHIELPIDEPEPERGDSQEVIRMRGWLFRANEALRYAKFDTLSGLKVTRELRKAIKDAAKAWAAVERELEQ